LTQSIEQVGLVFGGIGSLEQAVVTIASLYPGVMTCSHVVGLEFQYSAQHRAELNPLVAAHAGVRCAPEEVLPAEEVHDVGLELHREVEDGEGDIQNLANPARGFYLLGISVTTTS